MTWPNTPRLAALMDISGERERQEYLKAQGRFQHTCADPELTDFEKLGVLTEEVGEVARACGTGDPRFRQDGGNLRKEITQVAAICLAWLEGLDS